MTIIQPVYADTGHFIPGNLCSNYAFCFENSFGQLISSLLSVVFIIIPIIVTFYFLYGIFKLIISGGDKNQVASARDTITHAIIGLVILIVVFLFVKYLPGALGFTNFNILP